MSARKLKTYLNHCQQAGIFSAYQVGYVAGSQPPRILGSHTVKPNSVFDIASVTKMVATVTLTMISVEKGLLNVEGNLTDVLDDCLGNSWGDNGHAKRYQALCATPAIKIKHLLNHTSGLQWHHKFYDQWSRQTSRSVVDIIGRDWHRDRMGRLVDILSLPLAGKAGDQRVYSDLGFMILGIILELLWQKPLPLLFQELIADPLQMKNTFFLPANQVQPAYHYLPTSQCPFRNCKVEGVVNDLNCYFGGGASGHAGLFSDVNDLLIFSQALLSDEQGSTPVLVKKKTLTTFLEATPYPLGFDFPSGHNPAVGQTYSPGRTFGHLGFTGTSLWIDFQARWAVAFLTNRTYPFASDTRIRFIRPKVHDMVRNLIFVASH